MVENKLLSKDIKLTFLNNLFKALFIQIKLIFEIIFN